MAQNEGILEERDQIMEHEEFTEGTPGREVLLRVNHNKVHIGDGKDVNSGIQDSLCAVLSEIKSLKSQVNLLQSQVNLTSVMIRGMFIKIKCVFVKIFRWRVISDTT